MMGGSAVTYVAVRCGWLRLQEADQLIYEVTHEVVGPTLAAGASSWKVFLVQVGDRSIAKRHRAFLSIEML